MTGEQWVLEGSVVHLFSRREYWELSCGEEEEGEEDELIHYYWCFMFSDFVCCASPIEQFLDICFKGNVN